MKKEYLYSILAISMLFIFGCTTGTGVETTDLETGEVQKATQELNQLAGTTTKYYRFDKAHYEKSLEEGKTIFLDFHANWCPVCKREHPIILSAFNELNDANVVGYQVHFNDGETTAEDIEMAKKYGIVNQYTKVIVDKNDNIALKTLEILDKNRIINELKKVAGE